MLILTLVSMESSHLVIFSTSGKFITKFNVLRCISLSETLLGRIPTTLKTCKYFCACAKQQAQCNAVCPRKRDIADVTTKINSGRSCTAQVCNFNNGLTVTSIVVSISCPQGFLPVKVIVATANQNVLLFCCCPLCLLG